MLWSLNNLAPICIVPHCPKYKTRHLLPHQEEIAKLILQGNENYIYWQGGVGSAKTLLYAVISCAYHIMIPNSKSILFRKDLALNYQTLWGYFKNAVKAACDQAIIPDNYSKMWAVKKAGEHTYCTFSNGSIARCGQTKNLSEYLGPTYDLIVVSDAMENDNFGYIFRGEGTVGGLQSRLRGQVSTFYSFSNLPNSPIKDMRRFLIESNPPPNINELHSIFGREPGVRTFTNSSISYRHIQSNTLQNDHNPSTYIAEITSQHSSKSDIQRILQGKTVPYYGGKRVIETFYNELHVVDVTYDPSLILFVGIDPGTQHPAATFSQIRNCSYDKPHYITYSEISNIFDKTTNQFIELNDSPYLGLLSHLGSFYPDLFDYDFYTQLRKRMPLDNIDYKSLSQHFSRIRFSIDKSGNRKYTTNKDRQTDISILYLEYGIQCKALTNLGLDKSLDRIREIHQEICICTIPRRLINRSCSLLIDAYGGGYRYKKNKDGTHADKPINDHIYEDIADADRYSIENFYFMPWDEKDEPIRKEEVTDLHPWNWMVRRDAP